MASKKFQDGIPPVSTGVRYQLTTHSNNTTTVDNVTAWDQEPSELMASDLIAGMVLECEHSKSGTVHTLENPNANLAAIRFKATADYTSGDSFVVNGTAIITLNGTPAFVTGETVLAFLDGTTLNFKSSSTLTFIDDDERQIPNTWYYVGDNGSGEQTYKPHYECRVYIPNLPSSAASGTYVYSNYSPMSNCENVEYERGYYTDSSGNKSIIAFSGSSFAGAVTVQNIADASFQIYVGANRSAYSSTCYFRYTKTTDTAKTRAEIESQ